MKINWSWIIVFGFVLLVVIGGFLLARSEVRIQEQEKLFCDDAGGKYVQPECLIKENSYYQKYTIDWNWNEKEEREFFLIKE